MSEARRRTSPTRIRAILAGAAAVGALLLGCDAKVVKFVANPLQICAVQRVDLDWQVQGSATLTVTPPEPGLTNGPVNDEGGAILRPTEDTHVVLGVTRRLGDPTSSSHDILVIPPSTVPQVLAASVGDPSASPTCADGWASATIHPRSFSSTITVATVASVPNDSRTYTVQHGNVRTTVAPGAPSTAMAGLPVLGDWVVGFPLAAGQSCASIPNNFVIDVFTQCAPGGHP